MNQLKVNKHYPKLFDFFLVLVALMYIQKIFLQRCVVNTIQQVTAYLLIYCFKIFFYHIQLHKQIIQREKLASNEFFLFPVFFHKCRLNCAICAIFNEKYITDFRNCARLQEQQDILACLLQRLTKQHNNTQLHKRVRIIKWVQRFRLWDLRKREFTG